MKKNSIVTTITAMLLFPVLVVAAGKEVDAYRSTQGNTPPLKGYRLLWSDEFNRVGGLDTTYWNYEQGFVRNQELQWYQPHNALCKKGVLTIEGRRERFANPNYLAPSKSWRTDREFVEYTAASVTTRGKVKWKYGRLQVRARIPFQTGAWPAIWTLGEQMEWPYNGEVDLLELYLVDGKPSILANLATGTHRRHQPKWFSRKIPLTYFTDRDKDWNQKFHVWQMDWDEKYVRLYLDDELLNEIEVAKALNPDGSNPFGQEHFLLLNLAIGSNGGDPSHTTFPLLYEIDYVRIYQKTN